MIRATIKCPICEDIQNKYRFFVLDKQYVSCVYHQCKQCKALFLHYLSPQEQFYDENYYNLPYKSKFSINAVEWLLDIYACWRARRISSLISSKARILDVGCGDGRFLYCLSKTNKKFDLHGTEISPQVAKRAKKRVDHRAWIHTVETLKPYFPDNSFEAITLIQVFEHLSFPINFLNEARHVLRTNGFLIISYPNINSLQAKIFGRYWFHLDPPRHLHFVPPDYLVKLLEEKGFKLLKQYQFNYDQSLFGWVQSFLNVFSFKRDNFFEMFKSGINKMDNSLLKIIFYTILVVLIAIIPIVLVIDSICNLLHKGAIVELIFKKDK